MQQKHIGTETFTTCSSQPPSLAPPKVNEVTLALWSQHKSGQKAMAGRHSAENRNSSICKRQEGTRAWTPSSLPRQFREGCSVPQTMKPSQRGPMDVYAYTRALADKAEGPQRHCLKYVCFLLFIKITHTSGSWRKLRKYEIGTSLVVQWLRLRIQHRGLWFNPRMGTRSHMLQLRPSAAKYINIKKGNAE